MSADRTTQPLGERVVGVVLAGGASSRMGRDKALLTTPSGRSLLEHAVARLEAVATEVVIADGGRRYLESHRSVPDAEGAGPAAGLLAAAEAKPDRPLLALACDLPEVPVPLLARLASCRADWAVPRREGRAEPLAALYRPRALRALADRVSQGELSLQALARHPGLTVRFFDHAELRRFGDPDRLFLNLNRPGEWARWERDLAESGG